MCACKHLILFITLLLCAGCTKDVRGEKDSENREMRVSKTALNYWMHSKECFDIYKDYIPDSPDYQVTWAINLPKSDGPVEALEQQDNAQVDSTTFRVIDVINKGKDQYEVHILTPLIGGIGGLHSTIRVNRSKGLWVCSFAGAFDP